MHAQCGAASWACGPEPTAPNPRCGVRQKCGGNVQHSTLARLLPTHCNATACRQHNALAVPTGARAQPCHTYGIGRYGVGAPSTPYTNAWLGLYPPNPGVRCWMKGRLQAAAGPHRHSDQQKIQRPSMRNGMTDAQSITVIKWRAGPTACTARSVPLLPCWPARPS